MNLNQAELNVVEKRIEYDGAGVKLLLLLAEIQHLAVAKILSEEEIEELDARINRFYDEFKKTEYDSIAKSSQHIHMLISHVMPFVRIHKTWGLHSEQCKFLLFFTEIKLFIFQHVKLHTNPR